MYVGLHVKYPLFLSDFNDTFLDICVILGFSREIEENCVLLDYYATSNGNFLPTFRHNISVPS